MHSHVGQIFEMNRTHCSEIGVLEIQRYLHIVESSADQSRSILLSVVENSNGIDHIEGASLLRDIGCGEMKTSIEILGGAWFYDLAHNRALKSVSKSLYTREDASNKSWPDG